MPDDYDPYLDASDKNNNPVAYAGGNIQSYPRQAGKRSSLLSNGYGPLPARINPGRLYDNMTIRFKTHRRFTYVAIYIGSLERWFISGNGKWFDTNELTNDQMSEVLMRSDTSDIVVFTQVNPGHDELI